MELYLHFHGSDQMKLLGSFIKFELLTSNSVDYGVRHALECYLLQVVKLSS